MKTSLQRRSREQGGELVEFSLIVLFMLALIFLLVDVAWMLFAKATIQYAVREGVRYGVTGQTRTGMGHKDSIKAVVQERAIGFLRGSTGLARISVTFPNPTYLPANAGGNTVQVSVSNIPISPLAPLLRNSNALNVTVSSADIIEPSPGAGPPPQ